MNGFEDKKENEYASLSDGELVQLSRGGDSFATEYLLKKYKNLVRQRARTYFLAGADRDDLVQEGMIGLYKAMRDFDFEKNAAFKSFAELCIKRQIITAVKASTRKKHIPLNSYVSLSKPVFDDERDSCLEELLSEMNQTDPEEIFFRKENAAAMDEKIEQVLSKLEKQVLSFYLEGKSYLEIAEIMNRPPKSIDNALQRIKKKMEKYSDF